METRFAKDGLRARYAGKQVRDLRTRLGITQAAAAQCVGISISYLSQIESDDRPITNAVLVAFARAFPDDWAAIDEADATTLMLRASEAARDPSVPGDPLPQEALDRALRRNPELAQRLVAVHDAYQRTQEQLRTLDDAFESGGEGGVPLPWEEVRDWFHGQGNYIDTLDRASEDAASSMSRIDAAAIAQRLETLHRVTLATHTPEEEPGVLRAFDPGHRLLSIDRSLPYESQLFLMAHELMRLELADVIGRIAAGADLRSPESSRILTIGLANYAAGAFLMPYTRFRTAARAKRHDIDALCQTFGVSFEQGCHRLSTLQRPGARGTPFFFCRVDMAGNITKRHSATRFQFARFGGACPLWAVHEAVAIPDRIIVQLAETPDGIRYVSMAKGLVKPTGTYQRPARRYAVALGCEVQHARDFIYADQLDLYGPRSAVPIGTSCRICPRVRCEQRAFPPAGRVLEVDPNNRRVVPYSFKA